jgi:hypothetical protein
MALAGFLANPAKYTVIAPPRGENIRVFSVPVVV